jgi:hypothetical protein
MGYDGLKLELANLSLFVNLEIILRDCLVDILRDPHFNTGLKANTLRLRYLLMADDSMRDIRVFQVCDLFLDQFNRQSAHRIFQMCDLRCPDDRRSNRFLL